MPTYIKRSRGDVGRHSARKVFWYTLNYYYAIMFFQIGGIDPISYYLSESLVLFSAAKIGQRYDDGVTIVLQCRDEAEFNFL